MDAQVLAAIITTIGTGVVTGALAVIGIRGSRRSALAAFEADYRAQLRLTSYEERKAVYARFLRLAYAQRTLVATHAATMTRSKLVQDESARADEDDALRKLIEGVVELSEVYQTIRLVSDQPVTSAARDVFEGFRDTEEATSARIEAFLTQARLELGVDAHPR